MNQPGFGQHLQLSASAPASFTGAFIIHLLQFLWSKTEACARAHGVEGVETRHEGIAYFDQAWRRLLSVVNLHDEDDPSQ